MTLVSQRTDVLYRTLRRLVGTRDPTALYGELLGAALEQTSCADGFAARVDRERALLDPVARRGSARAGPWALDAEPAASLVAAADRPRLIAGAGLETVVPGCEQLLLVPLPGPRGPRGLVCVGGKSDAPLVGADLPFFTEIAEATSHLLHRRLTIVEREEELRLLWDVKRTLVDPDLDLDEANLSSLLAKILRIALRRTRTENGGIFLVDEETGDLVVEQQAVRGDLLGGLPDRLVRKRGDRGSGIIFWVIEQNRPYRSPDVSTDPLYLPFFRSIRSNLTVPLSFQDRAIGAIAVESVEPSFFGEDEMEALSALAREATLFIRRAQLYRQTRREGRSGILIKGISPEWVEVEHRVERAAATDTTVLIRGESGTGKELLAHSIHFNSRRTKRPFVVVNAGAIPETLLESELFGHVRGAFTGATRDKAGQFEIADGGTIFLDEIGDLSLPLQVKLLRTLQSGDIHKVGADEATRRVDVRVIAATNRNLEEMLRAGTYREDLYYRLNVVPIWLPPLRRYRESIPGMARAFAQELARAHRRPVEGISAEAMEVLLAYDWPGNVRELRNCIEQAVILEEGSLIAPESLPADVRQGAQRGAVAGPQAPGFSDNYHEARDACLRHFEVTYLGALLRRFGGNISRAAEEAGLSRVNLHRLLRKHGIKASEFRGG